MIINKSSSAFRPAAVLFSVWLFCGILLFRANFYLLGNFPEKTCISGDESQNFSKDQMLTGRDLAWFPLIEAWRLEGQGKILGITTIGNTIVWATEDGQVYLADSQNGQIIKVINLEASLLYPPVAGQNEAWLAGLDKLYCLEESGKIRQELNLPEKLVCPPLADHSQLFLFFADNKLKAIEASSDQSLWKYNLPAGLISAPALSDSSVFVPLTSNLILRLKKSTGEKIAEYQFKEPVSSVWQANEKYLFLALKSGKVLSFDLKKQKVRWQVSVGSQQIVWIVTQGKLLYVLTFGGILYALRESSGEIAWWQIIPGRIFFRPLLLQKEIFIPSASQILPGFDLKAGNKTSETRFPYEIRTDLVSRSDRIIFGAYDFREDKSYVYALRKEPQLVLSASKASPQPAGQRIVLIAQAFGFKRPKYEFYLQSADGQEKLRRKASASNTWTWFPVKEGNYTIIVRAFDKKLTRKTELRYNITQFIKENGDRKE